MTRDNVVGNLAAARRTHGAPSLHLHRCIVPLTVTDLQRTDPDPALFHTLTQGGFPGRTISASDSPPCGEDSIIETCFSRRRNPPGKRA
jgi:hypothetical protein